MTSAPLTVKPEAPAGIVRRRHEASEALLGVANGLVVGTGASAAGSALVTLLGKDRSLGLVFQNMRSNHLGAAIGATLALGAVNGLVRHAHARTYNDWADAHNHRVDLAFADRVDVSRDGAEGPAR